jgi:hypothetical protein
MRIVVVSDTHMQVPDKGLAILYDRFFAPADVLVHLGDMVGESLCWFFHQHPHFLAVRGNCDFGLWAEDMPIRRSFILEGIRIGAAHGWGPRSLVWKTVAGAFEPGHDLILYGHTHIRAVHQIPGGPWVCNPGSLCAPRDGKAGFAVIQVEAGMVPDISWVDV